jgi:hypothetical protein
VVVLAGGARTVSATTHREQTPADEAAAVLVGDLD